MLDYIFHFRGGARSVIDWPDRLIRALTDLKRQEPTVHVLLAGYLLVWTLYGVVAKGNQDLHPDMSELIAWSRDLALGFPKHPPFAAIIVRAWFALFPIVDWTYYLLAMSTVTLAIWIAWELYGDYLNRTKRFVALFLLTFIPFFNFHALKFNVNTLLMPLWALTTFWFLRSYRTRSPAYAAFAGASAAFCMQTKYWSIFLLAGLVAAALSDGRRAVYFRSAAPWITVVTGIAIISPHLGWLQKHNFSPIQYALLVHGNHSFGETVQAALRYLVDSAAYVSVPIGLVLLLARPPANTVAELAWPAERERRLVAVAFWSTLLLPVLPAVAWGIDINGLWSMPSWTLLPVLLLSSSSVQMPRISVRWIAGSAVVFPLVMLVAAPAIAFAIFERGLPPELTQSKALAEKVGAAWHSVTEAPLRYVGGDLAYGVAAYAQDRPQALLGLAQPAADQLLKSGMVLICYAEDANCIARSSTIAQSPVPISKIETELVRIHFGLAGRPQRYVIFIIPPAS